MKKKLTCVFGENGWFMSKILLFFPQNLFLEASKRSKELDSWAASLWVLIDALPSWNLISDLPMKSPSWMVTNFGRSRAVTCNHREHSFSRTQWNTQMHFSFKANSNPVSELAHILLSSGWPKLKYHINAIVYTPTNLKSGPKLWRNSLSKTTIYVEFTSDESGICSWNPSSEKAWKPSERWLQWSKQWWFNPFPSGIALLKKSHHSPEN